MKKILPIILVLFSCPTANAQQLVIDSTRFITGNKCCTMAQYAIATTDKGVLLVGVDNNNPGGIIPYFPDTSGRSNVLVVKIDSNQQLSWIRVFGGSQYDLGMSACQSPDGGYAIAATTSSPDGDITGFKGGNDIWVLKLDAMGNLLWEKTYGGPFGEQAISIANTPDGGFIILGNTNGAGGDVPMHYGGQFDDDWFVVKTDDAGNIQWTKTIGGTGEEGNYGSIFSVDTTYYIASSSSSRDHDCNDISWHPSVSNTGSDFHLLKLDLSGNVIWDHSYGGSVNDVVSYAMYDKRDSTIVIIGTTQSNDYMVTTSYGQSDIWVVKSDVNGALLWQKTLGSTLEETGTSICGSADDGYLAYGWTGYDPTGQEDMLLCALDNSGNEITEKKFGGILVTESSTSVVPYLNGYIATGFSMARAFTEGSTYGSLSNGIFVSYINYWPLSSSLLNKTADQSLYIYPNPTHGNTRIALKNNDNKGVVSILDPEGHILFTTKVKSTSEYIDLSTKGWKMGVYLVEWHYAENKVLTGKLIVN